MSYTIIEIRTPKCAVPVCDKPASHRVIGVDDKTADGRRIPNHYTGPIECLEHAQQRLKRREAEVPTREFWRE